MKSIINKIDQVITNWFSSDPILLGVWCLMEKIEDTKIKTVSIDTRNTSVSFRYNPDFLAKCNDEQLEFIMVSECFKVLLKHPTTRLKKPKNISNYSSQLTVNELLNKNFPLLSDDEYFITPEGFKLKPKMWYEYYFEEVMKQCDIFNSQMKQMFGSLQGDEKNQNSNQQQSNGDSGKGEGEGKNKKDDKNSNGKDENPLKEYMNPGNGNEYWEENDLFDANVKNMVDENKSSMKNWGKYTGDSMSEIIVANTPKISYKEIIRRFNNSIISTKQFPSRMKVNRRYDLAQPGKKREYKSKIIFAVDSSGSMSNDDLMEGLTVINSVCKHANIDYVLFDTEIKLIEKKIKKAKKNFKILGRGGTDFQEVCDYANTHKADGLVIYTDGYAPEPKKPNTKVLWLMTNSNCKKPCNWGYEATLKDRHE